MDIITIRKSAADFILEILEGVEKRVSIYRKAFDTGQSIVEYKINRRGEFRISKANMVGWIPVIRPDLARYEEFDLLSQEEPWPEVVTLEGDEFTPASVGIPLSDELWTMLTCPEGATYDKYIDCYYLNSSFGDVYLMWIRIYKRILRGELDSLLIVNR